jgi:N-acetylglucosamine kinase-like BadF-type ATPase
MDYILGIDQGASKTHAAVCDLDGRVLGVGRARGAYHSLHGMETAMGAVREAAAAAVAQAGVGPGRAALLYGGLTGADWPDEYALLQGRVAALGLAERVEVTNDSIVALRGGTSAPYGAVLVAGTGGNCAVRAPGGASFIYHYYHDDELQGGSALGRHTLRAIYRAATGREPETALTAAVLGELGLPDVDALLRADCEGRLAAGQVAGLAPLLLACAHAGDEVAARIVGGFGRGLAELVAAGLRRLGLVETPLEVVLSGSVFKGPGRLLQAAIGLELRAAAPRAWLVDARYEPVVGALLLGLEALGREGGASAAAIELGAARHGLIRTLG